MRMSNIIVAAAALVGSMDFCGTAHAADSSRNFFQNAAGACKPALPAFDGNIRTRPLAVANEGSATAFVSCSLPRAPAFSGDPTYSINEVNVRIYNRTGAGAIVGCTLVTSFEAASSNYLPKTVNVPANGKAFISWTVAGDNGGAPIFNPNFSCSLPPGLDVGYFYYPYNVPVGS